MKIRKANLKDIVDINRIYVEGGIDEERLQFPNASKKKIIKTFNKHFKERINGFKRELKNKKHYWILCEGKNMLGFGQAWIKNKDIGVLEKVYIDKKARGKGIATKISKKLIKWLKNKNVRYIEAGLYWKNIPSRKLNEKLGFKPISLKMRLEV